MESPGVKNQILLSTVTNRTPNSISECLLVGSCVVLLPRCGGTVLVIDSTVEEGRLLFGEGGIVSEVLSHNV